MEFLLSSFLYLNNAAPSPLKIHTLRIAVLDSGYNSKNVTYNLCNEEYNYTKETMEDQSVHGEVVNTIIGSNLVGLDYCIIPIKVFTHEEFVDNSPYLKGLTKARDLNPDILNISAGGEDYWTDKNSEEAVLIKSILDQGTIIVAAAGNDSINLDETCSFMPACRDNREITVGWLNEDGHKNIMSNYGNYIKKWRIGNYLYKNYNIHMQFHVRGTSIATPIVTGEIARKIILDKNKKNSYNN